MNRGPRADACRLCRLARIIHRLSSRGGGNAGPIRRANRVRRSRTRALMKCRGAQRCARLPTRERNTVGPDELRCAQMKAAGAAADSLVESTTGAVPYSLGSCCWPTAFATVPVPQSRPWLRFQSRSSNRTCGTTASGSRTRPYAFAHGRSRVRSVSRARPNSWYRNWSGNCRVPLLPRFLYLRRNHWRSLHRVWLSTAR